MKPKPTQLLNNKPTNMAPKTSTPSSTKRSRGWPACAEAFTMNLFADFAIFCAPVTLAWDESVQILLA